MIGPCESDLFPHDRDYDGTNADHLVVIPGRDLTPDSKSKENDTRNQRPALTEPEREIPADSPQMRSHTKKDYINFTTTEVMREGGRA
jgi:hypothetical protein